MTRCSEIFGVYFKDNKMVSKAYSQTTKHEVKDIIKNVIARTSFKSLILPLQNNIKHFKFWQKLFYFLFFQFQKNGRSSKLCKFVTSFRHFHFEPQTLFSCSIPRMSLMWAKYYATLGSNNPHLTHLENYVLSSSGRFF